MPKLQSLLHFMLQEINLEYPVCLEILRKVRALQCSQGHMICETCSKRLMRGKDEDVNNVPVAMKGTKKGYGGALWQNS